MQGVSSCAKFSLSTTRLLASPNQASARCVSLTLTGGGTRPSWESFYLHQEETPLWQPNVQYYGNQSLVWLGAPANYFQKVSSTNIEMQYLGWPALYFLLKTIHIWSVSSWRGLWWRSFTNNTGSTLTCLATLLNSILTWPKQPQKSRVDLEIATNQDLHKVLCTLWKIYWFARAA